MRLPDFLGIFGALIVGAVIAVFVLTSALGTHPALPTPAVPTLPPLPTSAPSSQQPGQTEAAVESFSTPGVGLAIGDRAPDLEVTLLDGSVMNTADFAGKPMWINFMATWCPQCRDELPMMTSYAKELGDEMDVLVVDVGEDQQTVKAFMKSLDFKLTVGVDTDGSAQRTWGTYALPVHYLIDDQGIINNVIFGGAPPEIFIQAITEVVPDFSVDLPTPEPTSEPTNEPTEEPTEAPAESPAE